MSNNNFDVVIVGSGAAGCVVASYVAEHTDASIAVIESGSSDNDPLIHIPAGYSMLLAHDKHVWPYDTVPQYGSIRPFRMGKVVGGGSSVNAMCYVRGQKRDFDAWHETVAGTEDWSFDTLWQTFIEQEKNDAFHNRHHGINGTLSVQLPDHINKLNKYCLKAFQEYGLPFNADYNGDTQIGTGPVQATIEDDKRCSAYVAHLERHVDSGRVTLLKERTVTRVLLDQKRAIGVEVLHHNSEDQITGDHIILSAGAVQTPKVLMHSGIGQRSQLEKFDIPVIHELSGVGENLHDHPLVPIAAHVKGNLGYQSAARGIGKIKTGIEYLATHHGPAAGNGIETVSYWDPRDFSAEPTIQCYHEPLISNGFTPKGSESGITFATVILQPKSRGTLRLADDNPTSMPLIDPNFLGDKRDLDLAVLAVKEIRKVMQQESFADVIEDEVTPGKDVQTDEQIAEFAKKVVSTMWHPVGTCRMGNDEQAVVDGRLGVKGISHLHVIDASIMPNITSGNTNAPTQMLARHGAKIFVREYFS